MYRIAVTNRHLCEGDYLSRVERLAEGNDYQAILLREKDLSEEEYERMAKDVLNICKRNNMKCILHSYPEVALRLEHPYLHLPLSLWCRLSDRQRNFLLEKMKEIGTSIHSLEQLEQAKTFGASYAIAGHIFVTDCKKGLEPRGLDFLKTICAASDIPIYGIGGIDKKNETSVIDTGASGVCIMSGCMRNK